MRIAPLIASATATAVVVTGLAALPALAQNVTEADCKADNVCLFDDDNFTGPRVLQYRRPNVMYNLKDFGFNDHMSSWKNRRPVDAKWFEDTGGHGDPHCMPAGMKTRSVGFWSNDHASSVQVQTKRGAC